MELGGKGTDVGPEALISTYGVKQLVLCAAKQPFRALLNCGKHDYRLPDEIVALGTDIIEVLATGTFELIYDCSSQVATQVLNIDDVRRGFSVGGAHANTHSCTALDMHLSLVPETPTYLIKLIGLANGMGFLDADGKDGVLLRQIKRSGRYQANIVCSFPYALSSLALIALACDGAQPCINWRGKFVSRCGYGVMTLLSGFKGFIIVGPEGVIVYKEAQCFSLRLKIRLEVRVFAARTKRAIASAQHVNLNASTAAAAQALAREFGVSSWSQRAAPTGGLPSSFTTRRSEIEKSKHLNDGQRNEALQMLQRAIDEYQSADQLLAPRDNGGAALRTFLQLADCTAVPAVSPYFEFKVPSLGLVAPGAGIAAMLETLEAPRRAKGRATLSLVLTLLRPTALWLFHVLAYMLYAVGGTFPVDADGRVVLPPELVEPTDLTRLARLVAQVLEFLRMDTRTTLDDDIDCLTLIHGVGYRTVGAYGDVVALDSLNQRETAALVQWPPVPGKVSDMETLDLVAAYGATLVETPIPP